VTRNVDVQHERHGVPGMSPSERGCYLTSKPSPIERQARVLPFRVKSYIDVAPADQAGSRKAHIPHWVRAAIARLDMERPS
jgi:hypothetical protein